MNIQLPGHGPKVSRQTIGWFAVFGSAFFFYLATLIIRWAEPHVTIESAYFVFARLLLGFIVVSSTMILQKQRLQPKRYHYLIGRTVANTVAVFCFYKAVETGSVAEANILNMTYPLFVAVFSWFFLRGQRDRLSLLIVAVAFAGVWLVLAPGDMKPGGESLWGLSSGISAAVAIIYLNISRRYHDSQTILFFMFGLGTCLMLIFFHDAIFVPNLEELFFLLSCSAAGVLGQYLITYGFLYVTAVEGSIISSSRILLAALLGPILVADPSLAISGWCGALLIFSANAALALRKA
ncbi:MAG: DMT family transporter [Desulfuromusa sp.]|jgi:drug/metabolite transporter (DMT)-like permease|nr:DMT family transporter [Desulfuromusa sp.]